MIRLDSGFAFPTTGLPWKRLQLPPPLADKTVAGRQTQRWLPWRPKGASSGSPPRVRGNCSPRGSSSGLEHRLFRPAVRAGPVLEQICKGGPRRSSVVGIIPGAVVDEAADGARVLLHLRPSSLPAGKFGWAIGPMGSDGAYAPARSPMARPYCWQARRPSSVPNTRSSSFSGPKLSIFMRNTCSMVSCRRTGASPEWV